MELLDFLDGSQDGSHPGSTMLITDLPSVESPDEIVISKPTSVRSSCITRMICTRLVISSSSVTLDGFDILGSVILTQASQVWILNSQIHSASIHSRSAALQLIASRDVTVMNVAIFDVPCQGLSLSDGSSATCSNLSICRVKETLVFVFEQSHLMLSDCSLQCSDSSGVYCVRESSIVIRNCSIADCQGFGVYMNEGFCVIEDTKFHGIVRNGVQFEHSENFRITRAEFDNCQVSAIAIIDESSGEVNECHIRNIMGNGIHVSAHSIVRAARNEIIGTGFPGFIIMVGCVALLTDSTITNSGGSACAIRKADDVRIERLTIVGAQECGFSISDTRRCIIRRCSISECHVAGLECYNGSIVAISKCKCVATGDFAFQVFAGGVLEANRNDIRTVRRSLCWLTHHGGGSIVSNRCEGVPQQLTGPTSGQFLFKRNGGFPATTNDETILESDMVLEASLVADQPEPCLRCGRNQRDCFLLSCGHRVYCQECGKLACSSKEKCPLCRFPIANATPGFDSGADTLCTICCDKPPDSIVTPCGHVGCCKNCLEEWFKSCKSCPICRNEPSSYRVVSDWL
jgi:hypothetical protein